MHFRKAFAALATLTLLITGCSNDDGANSETGAASETSSTDEASSAGAEPAADFPRTVTHSSGETTIESKPSRIVVLDMAALDTIDALGAGENVVGTVAKSVPTWLSDDDGIDYSTLTSVGSLKEPDMEAIAKLDPDLVVVGARSSGFYEEFSKMFPTINTTHSWDVENYSTTVPDSIRTVGQAVDYDAEADKLASDLEALLAEYKGMGKDKGAALVVMSNAGEISLHDARSRWAPIYDVFGFTEAYERDEADEGHKGEKVSFETVKEINPDWLFVLDRDAAVGKAEAGETAKQVLDNELIHGTTAWQKEQVVYLSPERWYIVMTGATNFPAMLTEIADAIK